MTTHSLFIKTYLSDLPWLEWSIKFLERNWCVQSEFVIGCPPTCIPKIKSWNSKLDPRFVDMTDWPDNGYLSQQYFKLVSDLYCTGDLITFIDSDSMLTKSTAIDNITRHGKPIVWYTPYSVLGNTVPWKQVVTEIMMLEPPYEFMRCHPFTYYRDTLANCRSHLERKHAIQLQELVRNRRNKGFSEFNIVGFYAYVFERDQYAFLDTKDMADWSRVRQFWSYGDWSNDMPSYLNDLFNQCG